MSFCGLILVGKGVRYKVFAHYGSIFHMEDQRGDIVTLDFSEYGDRVEMDESGIRCYHPGKRELTAREKMILETLPYQLSKQERSGVSGMYQKKSLLESMDALHLMGFGKEKGQTFLPMEEKVLDESVKGELALHLKVFEPSRRGLAG